ncbi:MAG TPA: hypothetical protein VM120_06445, partial [Bryobacteraceae bacterium]|nr:hypothetical protein [Bryobacteraceae bacterium]
VRIMVDPFPEKTYSGALDAISPLTEQNFEWPPTRNFRGAARLKEADPRLRPGMNGRLDIIVDRLPDAISVPSKALFTRAGRPVVYVAHPGGYRPVWVEVLARNVDEVAVRGLSAGATVTLVEPEARP